MATSQEILDFFNKVAELTLDEIEEILYPIETELFYERNSRQLNVSTNSTSLPSLGDLNPVDSILENHSHQTLTNSQRNLHNENHTSAKTLTKSENYNEILKSDGNTDEEKLLLDPRITKFALLHLGTVAKKLKELDGKTIHILTGSEDIELTINEENMLHLLGFVSESILKNGYTNEKMDVLDYGQYNSTTGFTTLTPTKEESLNTQLNKASNNATKQNIRRNFTRRNLNTEFSTLFQNVYPLIRSSLKTIEQIMVNQENQKSILYKTHNGNIGDYSELWNKICFKTANTEKFIETIIANSLNDISIFKGTINSKKRILLALKIDNKDLYSCVILSSDKKEKKDFNGNNIYDSNGNKVYIDYLYPESSDYIPSVILENIKTDGTRYYADPYNLLGTNDWRLLSNSAKKFVLCLNPGIDIKISKNTIKEVKKLRKESKKSDSKGILDIYRIKSNNEEVVEIIDSYKQELSNFLINNQEKLENMLKDLFDNSKTKKELKINLPELLIQYFQNSSNNEDLKNAYLSIAKSSISNKDMLNLINLSYINNQEWLKTELFKDRPFIFNYSLTKSNYYNLKFNILVNGKELNFEGSINEFLDNYYDLIQSLIIELKDDIDNVEIKNNQQAKDYLYNLNVYNQLCVLFDSSVIEIMSSISNDKFGFTQRSISELKEDNEEIYNKLLEIGCIKETDELFFETQRNIPISSIKENYLKSIAYNKAISNLNNIPEDTNEYLISYISSLTEEELLNNLIGANYSDILNDLSDLDDNLTAKDIKDCYELTSEQVNIILNIQELNLYGELLNNLNDKEKTYGLLRKINMVYANRNPLVVSPSKQKILKLENVG